MNGLARHITVAMTARGGIRFSRRADGAVVVHREVDLACTRPPAGWFCTRGADHDGPCAAHSTAGDTMPRAIAHELLAIIPANEWASIISSLCSDGEDAFTFNIALAFHTGGVAYDPEAHEKDTEPRPERAW